MLGESKIMKTEEILNIEILENKDGHEDLLFTIPGLIEEKNKARR